MYIAGDLLNLVCIKLIDKFRLLYIKLLEDVSVGVLFNIFQYLAAGDKPKEYNIWDCFI